MKIVHISTSDIRGGAARSAFRLHQALRESGADSSMYVADKDSEDPFVHRYSPENPLHRRLGRAFRKELVQRAFRPYISSRPDGYEHFRDERTEFGSEVLRQLPSADLIHLHWIASFLDLECFFRNEANTCPVVWTLHDMNPFTGGCHFDSFCGRYTNRCGQCPQLGSPRPDDLSHRIWTRKKRLFDATPADRLFFVAPSNWLAGEARKSSLLQKFSTTVIPYGIDTQTFRPRDSGPGLRQALGIPLKARVILFLAEYTNNRRKGFAHLDRSLCQLKTPGDVFLLSLGKGMPSPTAPFPHLHLGAISNDTLLASIYSLADLFVIPSIQDNLPNTVMEAMACGTPVAGFDTGGIGEMVETGKSGHLVPVEDTAALATALDDLLNSPQTRTAMGERGREIVLARYPQELQAIRYRRLYHALSGQPGEGAEMFASPELGFATVSKGNERLSTHFP